MVRRQSLLTRIRAKQVPPVAGDVQEDADAPIRFSPGRRHKRNTCIDKTPVRRLEVLYAEEEADAPRELSADDASLRRPIRFRQE